MNGQIQKDTDFYPRIHKPHQQSYTSPTNFTTPILQLGRPPQSTTLHNIPILPSPTPLLQPPHHHLLPLTPQDHKLRHRRARRIIRRIILITTNGQGHKPATPHRSRQIKSRRIAHIGQDLISERLIVRRTSLDILQNDLAAQIGGGDPRGVVEDDVGLDGEDASPVEEESDDGLDGLGGEVDGEGAGDAGEQRLPGGGGVAVDGAEGELAFAVVAWGGDGQTLDEIAGDGLDAGDLAVGDGDGAARSELVFGSGCVADVDGDGSCGECFVCGC